MTQCAGGAAASEYCVPQAVQMKAGMMVSLIVWGGIMAARVTATQPEQSHGLCAAAAGRPG